MKRTQALFFAIALLTMGLLLPPVGFSQTTNNLDDGCEECHSEFEAFSVIIDAPQEVPSDYEFDYKVIVRNNGEHEVQDLEAIFDLSEAEFLMTSLEGGESYHEEISDSVSIFGTATFTFPITKGATEATVILDGEDGLVGANDLDMTVTGPNGDSKSSANSGADEAVLLRGRDIRNWGYGDYIIDVVWFIGNPSISFTLEINVEYGAGQIIMQGEDLSPGGEFVFKLPLLSTNKGENKINVAVTGTAYHEHAEDDVTENSGEYTIGDSSSLKVGSKFVYSEPDVEREGSFSIVLMERVLGLLSAIGLVVSLGFSGIYGPVSSRMENLVGGAAQRVKWHCRSSKGILFLSLMHGILLPLSPHAANLRGLLPGTLAFILMGVLGYIGWKQNVLRKQWGNEKWKRIHLMFSITIIIIVIYHAVMDGTDFAWLR
jgi:uncharacterized protein affecting Mg2+/Co2+ transport